MTGMTITTTGTMMTTIGTTDALSFAPPQIFLRGLCVLCKVHEKFYVNACKP